MDYRLFISRKLVSTERDADGWLVACRSFRRSRLFPRLGGYDSAFIRVLLFISNESLCTSTYLIFKRCKMMRTNSMSTFFLRTNNVGLKRFNVVRRSNTSNTLYQLSIRANNNRLITRMIRIFRRFIVRNVTLFRRLRCLRTNTSSTQDR